MKLLKDKYFEWDEKLELRDKSDFDLEVFFDEIRDVVSSIFTEYNCLKEDGVLDIKDKMKLYLENLKNKYSNEFIKNIWVSWLYENKLFLWSRFHDKTLSKSIDKDSLNESEKVDFEAIACKYNWSDHLIWTMIDVNAPEPWDIWYFSSFEELEKWFIKKYNKLKKISLPKLESLELKDFCEKFNFKYSKHTKTYLKPIYIKWSFNNEKENEGAFLNISIRNKLRDLLKNETFNLKDFNSVVPSESKIRNDTLWKNIDHAYELVLKNDEKIDVVIIDDEVITFSLDKSTNIEWIYDFLRELYFNTKEELIQDVKTSVEHVLMNFSSEHSNIINQYNYLLKTTWVLNFKKKKTIKSEIDLDKNTFIYSYTPKTERQSNWWRIVNFKANPKSSDLIWLWINRIENNFIRVNSIQNSSYYSYKVLWIIDIENVSDRESNLLSTFIIKSDLDNYMKWKDINWEHYWFSEYIGDMKWMDFIQTFDWIWKRIVLDDLNWEKRGKTNKEIIEWLTEILTIFFKKSFDVNDWVSFINDEIKLKSFFEKLLNIISIDDKSDYDFYFDIFKSSIGLKGKNTDSKKSISFHPMDKIYT